MSSILFHRPLRLILVLGVALLVMATLGLKGAAAAGTLTQVSSDPYTNSGSQHKTEVEPDNFSFGSTIVNAFQVGRFTDGGSSNIGWATSTNNGTTWTHGFLPGTTVNATPAGIYDRISDPTVAYDASHHTWMIAGLAIKGTTGAGVIVSRSSNGINWTNPVTVFSNGGNGFVDKDWIVCDNSSGSKFYGHCYVEYDDAGNGDLVQMSTSTNGGQTWSAPQATADSAGGLGGQPLVQPNGTVIVPFFDNASNISAFTSTNGGGSWNSSVVIAPANDSTVQGGLRAEALPSAEIDGSGKVYVVWQSCAFEANCATNDIVLSTSTNGTTWTSPQRIPADPLNSGADHFIPGIAVDKATSGTTAHLAVTFYYYPNGNCSASTCQLDIGFVSSTNGGATWSAKQTLAGPMKLSWLANTTQGVMVGDYISTTIAGNGKAFPIVAVATANNGSLFHEAMDTVTSGLALTGGKIHADTTPVSHAPIRSHSRMTLRAY